MQTMAKQAGPLMWVIFGGEAVGNGSSYDDDGNTTQYIVNEGVKWASLQYETAAAAGSMSINISGNHGYTGHAVQLRMIQGSPPVEKVTCGERTLPKIGTY
jgi:hypothetical protein